MNEREASSWVDLRESMLSLYNTRLGRFLRRTSPWCSFCRASNGLRVHEAINIITERERVGIIVADDRKKNDYRKRDGVEQESEEKKEDSEKEEVVWWWYILK